MIILTITACRDKVVCPAFQSAYILDDSVRQVYYSYLWKLDEAERLNYLSTKRQANAVVSDSSASSADAVVASNNSVDYFAYVEPYMTDPREVRKSKFGMVKYEPYWLKNYQLRTAPKENVLTPPPPSVPVADQGEFYASDFNDSISADTTNIPLVSDSVMLASSYAEEDSFEIPKLAQVEPPKPATELKYLYRYDPNDKALNVEQEYYNRHFGQYLYARVPIQQPVEDQGNIVSDSLSTDNGGFFKGLFSFMGKKKVVEEDPLVEEPPLEEPPVDESIKEDPNSGF